MHVHRAPLAVGCAVFALSCGSPTGPDADVPDVRGTWSSGSRTWGWSVTSAVVPGQNVSTTGCQGSLQITEQNGSAFSGRYSISCSGAVGSSSGTVLGGQVGERGAVVSFRLRADEGWAPGLFPVGGFNPPCPVTRDPEAYTGAIFGGTLSVSRVQALGCEPQPVLITASFSGARN
jgi:hypothetical protein